MEISSFSEDISYGINNNNTKNQNLKDSSYSKNLEIIKQKYSKVNEKYANARKEIQYLKKKLENTFKKDNELNANNNLQKICEIYTNNKYKESYINKVKNIFKDYIELLKNKCDYRKKMMIILKCQI